MKNKVKSFCIGYWIEIFIFVILAFIIFWRLGKFGLADWDESIYADISRNVLHGNILTLKWGNGGWFQKPPLYMWVEASFFKFFGISELSARLTSALSGLGLSYLIYIISRKFFNKTVAIAALATVLLNSFLLAWFRFATTDIFVIFLNTLAIYFFWISQENKKYLIWCFIILGIAGMTKGPVVVSVGLVFLFYLLSIRQLMPYFKSKYFWIGLVLFLLIILPWHLYMLEKFGTSFYNDYYVYHILTRAKIPIEGHSASWMHYPKVILYSFPLSIILLFSILVPIKELISKKKEFIFLLIWIIIQYCTVAKVATVLDWYILPVFVPLQIISAAVLIYIYKKKSIISKIIIIILAIFSIFLELRKPYINSWSDSGNSKNKVCLLEYNKIIQSNYYFYGYDFQLPTIIFYLQSGNINQINSFDSVPKGNTIMVKNNTDPKTYDRYTIIQKMDGCVLIKN